MGDEVLARAPSLVRVVHAREDECLLNPRLVDRHGGLLGMFFDDREEVAEQATLLIGQLGAIDRLLGGRMLDAVDLSPWQQRPARPLAVGRGARNLPVAARALGTTSSRLRSAQALRRAFSLLRYRRPSSYR
jgi:hypothetical protein